MAVSWRFDGDDRLCGVGEKWFEFALANDGQACVPPPIGRELIEFISSTELCVVWGAIFRLSRKEHDRAVTLNYRCDSPSARLFMTATVTSNAHHEIGIVSSVDRLEPRPAMPVLDASAEDRSDELLRMCGWCARVLVDDWVDMEEGCRRLHLLDRESGPLPRITHGICDDCKDRVARDLGATPGFHPANRRHL